MPSADNVRGVLQALLLTHPETGPSLISGLDIRRGWADAIVVTLYPDPRIADRPALRDMKRGIEQRLSDTRHLVTIADAHRSPIL